jgi:hypothetical protein
LVVDVLHAGAPDTPTAAARNRASTRADVDFTYND